jgi:hypothetical protein
MARDWLGKRLYLAFKHIEKGTYDGVQAETSPESRSELWVQPLGWDTTVACL